MFGGGHPLAQETSKPTEAGKALRRLLGYFRPFWGLLAAAAALMVVATLLQLLPPYLTGLAVDQFIAPSGEPLPTWLARVAGNNASRTTGLTVTMVTLLATYVLSFGASVGQFYLMTVAGQRVLMHMRTQIFQRIQTLSLKFFDQHEAGDLMSRLVSDTEVINQVLGGGIMRLASMGLSLVGIVASMLTLNWRMALVSFIVLPFMVLTTTAFSRRARVAFRRTRHTIGQVSAELQENIAGVREVQAFSREDENVQEFRSVNAANRDANVQAQSIMSAFSPALDVLSTVALAVVTGYGGYLVLGFSPPLASVGTIVAFLLYVRRFYEPIRMIGTLYTQLQSAIAGAERVFELLDTEPDVQNAPNAVELPEPEGRVEFDGVSFQYQEDKPVLCDVSVIAEPGQTIALVGPTGVGKTTIVSLLLRFYDVNEGAIRIDGHDIRDVTLDSLRRHIGLVLQDTFLFSGTVMENIRYGRLDASEQEVMAAAELANAHAFIMRLPEGYQTQLGERGHNISQGQRQLVAIARAVLANPRILVLDEATSNVDTRTELLIQRALDTLLVGRTSFVIAHRLSTIRNASQVIVLEEGGIVERGTHEELLAAKGRYHAIYSSQFRRQPTPTSVA
ncbi:MAG: ABC transporter ATP-binding protein [Anaerolineales bacterium]|nr:ABC transporter ATP-binding protein [Anaerolineales bacterium]